MKLAMVVTDNFSAWNFRRELLRSAVEAGIETYLLAPSGRYDEHFQRLGIFHIPVQVNRLITPTTDLLFIGTLHKIFRKHKFDIVHNVSIKPNIYGAMAARLTSVPKVVASVTGLGSTYMQDMGVQMRLLRPFVSLLYRFAFSLTQKVWFQNPDDVNFFVSSRIVDKGKVVLIKGSGVNLEDFSSNVVDPSTRDSLRKHLGINNSTAVIAMVTRTFWNKGVDEFIEASRIIGSAAYNTRFLLIGDGEKGNSQSIPAEYLKRNQSANFTWLGWRDDVRDLLAMTDVAVLLSHNREGLPKSLIEAMAMNKPIVTTNVPGCREVVKEGENGYLVEPRNATDVAEALKKLLSDSSKMVSFGVYSRKKAENEFNAKEINKRILSELYGLSEMSSA